MGRTLEAGAQGIMYPRCDNAEEAREVVRWAKFGPQGQRGFDSGNADNPYCFVPPTEYIEQANNETFVIIQLESPEALEQADEIAHVDGIDALVIGPADFSILAGVPGQFHHPKIDEALQRIAVAAEAAGIHWGCPGVDATRTAELMDRGARVFYSGSDMLMVKQGLEELQRDFAALGFEFDRRMNI
jgi:4-hydroxy-2-oxoheptanedioate aldolase